MSLPEWFIFGTLACNLGLLILFSEMNQERRDLLTDMSQLIHDGTVDEEDLRRCRDHGEIQRRFERREGQ